MSKTSPTKSKKDEKEILYLKDTESEEEDEDEKYGKKEEREYKEPKRTVRLPSLQKRENYPGEVHIEESPITAEDEKEFRKDENVFFLDPDVRYVYNKLRRGTDIDAIAQVVKPEDIINFANNEQYRNRVLAEIRTDIDEAKNHDLRDALVAVGVSPKIFKKTVMTKKKWLDVIQNIIAVYDGLNNTKHLQYILQADTEIKHKIDRPTMAIIENKEMSERGEPKRLANELLKYRSKYNLSGDEAKTLQSVVKQIELDELRFKHGYINKTQFEDAIADARTNIVGIIRNDPSRTDIDEEILKNLYVDSNILNSTIKKISTFIHANPNSQVGKYLNKILDESLAKLKDGKINLDQFYASINSIRKLMKPTIAQGDEAKEIKYLKRSVVKVKEPIETDIISPSVSAINPDADTSGQYFRNFRKLGAFAFSGFSLKAPETVVLPNQVFQINQPRLVDLKTDVDYLLNLPVTSEKNLEVAEVTRYGISALDKLRFNVKSVFDKTLQLQVDPNKYKMLDDTYFDSLPADQQEKFLKQQFKLLKQDLLDIKKYIRTWDNKLPVKTRALVESLRTTPLPSKKAVPAIPLLKVLPGPVELHATQKFEDEGNTPEEKEKNRQKRLKTYSQENFKYAKRLTREEPEIQKAYYGKNIIEYDIKNEADLTRMKFEISKMDGELYVIDLHTGRLYPIAINLAFTPNTYIFMRKGARGAKPSVGGSFAYHPAFENIVHSQDQLFPYKFMREGRDKTINLLHRVPNNPNIQDYRDQLNQVYGGSFWSHIRKGIQTAASVTASTIPGFNIAYSLPPIHKIANKLGNQWLDTTQAAGKQLGKQTAYEGRNFVNQYKQNINNIYSANKKFYNNPNISNFGNALNTTTLGIQKMYLQPTVSTARQAANISDFAGNVPGLNVAKFGIEYAVPPLKIADSLAHAAKSSGYGSDQKTNYLDTAIALGDTLLSSKVLSGNAETGAKLINNGVKLVDYAKDKHNDLN